MMNFKPLNKIFQYCYLETLTYSRKLLFQIPYSLRINFYNEKVGIV